MATYSFFGDLILGMSEAVVNMDIAFDMCEREGDYNVKGQMRFS